ncbi:MAG: aldehyde ferredoxin oxidoreductase N-terminal domain-containing protein, partial [Bacillota bacterium]
MANAKILRVDMATLKTARETPADDELVLGGRSLIVHRLLKEVPPTCDPLRRHNKLLLLPGVLGGTLIPCSGRLSAGGKSPLTGGVKEANGGGTAGHKLARLGIKSLIFEGLPEKRDAAYLLLISKDSVEFVPCPELRGMGVYKTAQKLLQRYGKKVSVILIGPAGELQLTAAGITNTDRDGEPSRYCARGGLGALMGSKGVKAVVLDDEGTTVCPSHDREKLDRLIRECARLVKANPQTAEVLPKFGTDSMLNVTNPLGGLPTRNFSTGTFEGADKIGPEALRAFITSRGGDPTHACMPG